MISKTILQQANQFALSEIEKYQVPSKFHLELANNKGQILSQKLKANESIVYLGTTLMDCGLGEVFSKGNLKEHINTGVTKTKNFLDSFSELSRREKENILACVSEHHGVPKFFSLESEICCNSDCYRFVSVEGVLGGIINGRKMELENMVKLYLQKADEKWNALSLDICRKELRTQYKSIKEFLTFFIK
ncbi:hypothetical protein A2X44_04320 [candidate division CPR3 bacterium GWF2_35_18]|uniref:HD domain-containing protein n=1 Tax=candidate division CPR3 bacterium GW2011_GWF2_35_18 TaxID=1618350 RepID=A0A0G0BIN8_UNCC3|nr:MAG: hypothetical protein UR67_C0007G0054 [candidate division CPR3 bacterium GW2011_GWF2_35_18]KKP86946.1 MAG: hypothetical protein UR87_C0007G0008 [candidate division CPR3 bacterium GW2011_GWE2_35_7]OGB62580.1 MAG: hypothetical protein A2X44_04320 [candidate division CPR3 bacterium GWF2_35_18]OGB65831.1 MAG: hypothetical protein A2250_01570 [candidate division CPR3 bacterium RIFOXYA2_FULL_35_13]OGB77242.1 MAG: hypothetical protein A2476_01630 [candidate division CPR3 bacterium RIFOXYC2_FULL